ncbi:hypothetical protein [Plantactinospora sp. DSM 117369]
MSAARSRLKKVHWLTAPEAAAVEAGSVVPLAVMIDEAGEQVDQVPPTAVTRTM